MITFLLLTITSSSFNIAKGTEIFESPWLLQLFSECSRVLFGPLTSHSQKKMSPAQG